MKIKQLYPKLSIICIVFIISGCAVYEPLDVNRLVSSSVVVSNWVPYYPGIYPAYNNGIAYTTPSPLYFNYYPPRPNPYYRPYYLPPRPYPYINPPSKPNHRNYIKPPYNGVLKKSNPSHPHHSKSGNFQGHNKPRLP